MPATIVGIESAENQKALLKLLADSCLDRISLAEKVSSR
jgi:hypothetical protein